jgi:hypothetical protein
LPHFFQPLQESRISDYSINFKQVVFFAFNIGIQIQIQVSETAIINILVARSQAFSGLKK